MSYIYTCFVERWPTTIGNPIVSIQIFNTHLFLGNLFRLFRNFPLKFAVEIFLCKFFGRKFLILIKKSEQLQSVTGAVAWHNYLCRFLHGIPHPHSCHRTIHIFINYFLKCLELHSRNQSRCPPVMCVLNNFHMECWTYQDSNAILNQSTSMLSLARSLSFDGMCAGAGAGVCTHFCHFSYDQ